mgnify:CR=1 FL=1
MNSEIKQILEAVQRGEMDVDDALLRIKTEPFEDIGYAKVDLHRKVRQGAAEVIYGAGKTPEQIARIVDAMRSGGQDTILITRMSDEAAAAIDPAHPFTYYEMGRIGNKEAAAIGCNLSFAPCPTSTKTGAIPSCPSAASPTRPTWWPR